MMDSKGILIVVSGFSGAGKGTLMKELLKNHPGQYTLSISATTRQPRDGEEDGREYFFITTEEFEKMIAQDQLIEYARYVNNYYGTPRAYVEQKLEEGKDVILEIEIQGAMKVKKAFPKTVLLFVTPPTAGELKHRLTCRGTETEEVIDSRLRRAVEEADGMDQYDHQRRPGAVCEGVARHCPGRAPKELPEYGIYGKDQAGSAEIERRIRSMLHPSYTDLMKVVNKDVEEGETKIVNSRYSIVLATSKRARQIIDGELPMVNIKSEAKPLSLAIQELNEGKLKIIAESAAAEEEEQAFEEALTEEVLEEEPLTEEIPEVEAATE